MENTALITGGSSGIGLELARQHVIAGGSVILVAKEAEGLREAKRRLQEEFAQANVVALAKDLAKPHAAKELYDYLRKEDITIDVLINNAGVGTYGFFYKQPLDPQLDLLQLNLVTLTELTYFILKDMVKRGSGKVLNVASMAGFLPGPKQAVYFASKAYVQSFSLSLANEIEGTGVTVTALCPGPMQTNFLKRAGVEDVKAYHHVDSAEDVAAYGYAAMLKGDLLAIPTARLRRRFFWLRFASKARLLRMMRKAMDQE